MSSRARTAIAIAATIVMAVALVRHYRWLGGPYFALPATVQDHVWPTPFASRDVILLAERAAKVLPRGMISDARRASTIAWRLGCGSRET